MVVSVATLAIVFDLFAPFTAPFSIGLGFWAMHLAPPGSRASVRAGRALWLAIVTIVLWVPLILLYNVMNAWL